MCERIRVNITGKGKTCAKAQMEVGKNVMYSREETIDLTSSLSAAISTPPSPPSTLCFKEAPALCPWAPGLGAQVEAGTQRRNRLLTPTDPPQHRSRMVLFIGETAQAPSLLLTACRAARLAFTSPVLRHTLWHVIRFSSCNGQ